LSSKIRKQVNIARTPVYISTSLPEDVFQSVQTYVEDKFNQHEKTIGYKPDDDKKVETLIITLLDVAAELISAKQDLKKFKLSESEVLAEVDALNKRLDDFSKQIEE
jgi:hypothetical protein